jgi:hypothetical protein
LEVRTDGFRAVNGAELRIKVGDPNLLAEGQEFLRFVVSYVSDSGRKILAEETLNYGYWLVKFRQGSAEELEIWEYNPEATDFVCGGTLTLHYWREQHRVCSSQHATFAPPRPDKLTMVSAGVLEGLPINGVRYALQEHMSGWLLVSSEYDGNIKSLTSHHTYHVTAIRPDVAPFLALPVGYRFELGGSPKIWLDSGVATQRSV